MPIDKYGFLGDQINEFVDEMNSYYKHHFELIRDMNEFAQEIKFKFQIDRDNQRQLIAGCLFIKVLNSFQSAIILCQRGLLSDARSINRVSIENVIKLKLICEDKSFIDTYIQQEKLKRLKIINIILNDRSDLFGDEQKFGHINEETRDTLKAEIQEEGIKEITIEKLANDAQLECLYQLAYRSLSDYVHTTVYSLNQYLFVDEKTSTHYLDSTPKREGITSVLGTAVTVMLVAIDSVGLLFQLKIDDDIKKFQKRSKSMKCVD